MISKIKIYYFIFVLFHIVINLRGSVAKNHTVPKIDDF